MTEAVTLVGYALIAAGFAAAEVVARRAHRWPPFGEVVTTVLYHRLGRAVLVAGWLWLGWHVFVRSTPGG